MKAMTRNRRGGLPGFSDEFARFFGSRGWPFAPTEQEDLAGDWAPAVDIKEDDKRFVVRADLPGVAPEDIEVTMENGALTIRGARSEERRSEGEDWHRLERFSGSFFRRFQLPDVVDAEAVEARTDKGVLEVVIPKTERRQARRIAIGT